MQFIKLLVFFYTVLQLYSYSSTLGDVLRRESRVSPIAHRLYVLSLQENFSQDASIRRHAPALPPTDPASPSHFLSPIKRERKALLEFAQYNCSHLPTVDSPKEHMTPLNPSTVLSAALRTIQVGESAPYFASYTFFSEDSEHPESGQMVLQAPIDLSRTDSKGRTNLERMKEGKSPIGADSKKFNLHHLLQTDGILLELTSRSHRKLHNLLHHRLSSRSSRINRSQFRRFREKYWKDRLLQMETSPPPKLTRKSLFNQAPTFP